MNENKGMNEKKTEKWKLKEKMEYLLYCYKKYETMKKKN